MHIKEVSDRMPSVHDVISSCAQVHTGKDSVIYSKLLAVSRLTGTGTLIDLKEYIHCKDLKI